MTLSITRVFVHSDYLKTISSIFNQLLEKEAGWSPPKIYVLGGYNAYWWPEFWRMVQHARSTKMAPVAVRMARHDTPACVSLSNSKGEFNDLRCGMLLIRSRDLQSSPQRMEISSICFHIHLPLHPPLRPAFPLSSLLLRRLIYSACFSFLEHMLFCENGHCMKL